MNIQSKIDSRFAASVALLAMLTLLLALSITKARAQEEPFIEGGHYELLDQVQPVQTADKIEVVEMFWYRCPHCYRWEPFIVEWRKTLPDHVQYVPIPALLSAKWEFHAKAYYTFAALGVVEQLHGKFFSAIHVRRLNIDSVDALADWAAENGVQRQSIIDAFGSFAVENKLSFASVMTRKYGISGVPAIIVDGRYRTTAALAGSQERLMKVIDFLIEKAVQARAN
ncbi:thiol:disulfide interchange protein DsbA/DsbL [Candidatus Spongiihabitans sp.]|uniref:thiol:disulfide interchange protein DsbA/DsbL n=1 Tax=Candidatus Spongiihabitans sp. TaxID=3101308 RepID=UPI003C7BB46F